MDTLNSSINRVREKLGDPKDQKPSVKMLLGAILQEVQNQYNQLANSSKAWTTREVTVNLNGQNDYLIVEGGKPLFVTANQNGFPYAVEFTDLQDASQYWWYQYPLTAARPEDYNGAFPVAIAFYRKNGQLYMRTPSLTTDALTITLATGDWIKSANLATQSVMTEYRHLPEIRAALNLLPSTRWTDDANADRVQYEMRKESLERQLLTVNADFIIAKRNMTADDISYIGDYSDGWDNGFYY